MRKTEARVHFKDLRKGLNSQEIEKMNGRIRDLLFSRLMIHRYSPIHLYLPIKRNNEVDSLLILETLRRDFAPDIYISKSLDNGELLHVKFEATTNLETNRWGIDEPLDLTDSLSSEAFFELFKTEDILIFVPLLAFDKKGNRVGYGKGYYDRFLQYATKDTTIVGLSLFEPIDSIDDTDQFDVRMHFCITPERIWAW
ncbi:5-formyltetrahydrofolate cyclo-ligase [Lacihabitans soyangensis]|uniref:5-formyltetrahydrofolate cyclo-ligase n=1 Tax=Lacihabitans soyangensis TaxID=869394 RepID=A0AAE3KVU7_9BACT|nr:5-formyltetrahydrofolate cyclo-ligase [Lacihabitans soyangensis]MCP9761770.1 5-formyltetrahydrofolate cyclo-ligase [Lacihabitans soyangensis]